MIYEADTVIAMNQPSLQSFERLVKPGGNLFINRSLVQTEPIRSDISIYKVPCSELANELGNTKAANMVMFGAILSATKILSEEAIEYVLQKVFSGKKAKHLDLNRRAIKAFKCE